MFRYNQNSPKIDQFDSVRIQQQIATINFLAETLKLSTDMESVHLHLDVLLKAIKKFEAMRFTDYALNNTKRASKLLSKIDMFKALHKDLLKKSNSYFISKALKTSLKTYSHSVESSIAAVQEDLKARLTKNHNTAMYQQESALLDKELDTLSQQSDAFRLEYAQLENIEDLNADAARISQRVEYEYNARQQAEDEEGYDYYGVQDMEISEEELKQKPYLVGNNLDLTADELEWLLAIPYEEENSDTEIISDPETDTELSDIIESPSPVQLRRANAQFFKWSPDSDSDSESDFSADEEDEDHDLTSSRSPMLRF